LLVAAVRLGETLGWWHVDRMVLLAAHALLGAVGFGTLMIVGVGSRMLPTFLMGPGDDTRLLRAVRWLVPTSLAAFVAGAASHATITRANAMVPFVILRVAGLGLVVAGALVLWLLGRWYRRRGRPLDAALKQIATAVFALSGAWLVGVNLLLGRPYRIVPWAVLLLLLVLGWLVPMVLGVMAKILPHLAYRQARAFPGFAARGTPNALLHPGLQRAGTTLLTIGLAIVCVAALGGWADPARIGAGTWSVGAVLSVALYAHMFAVGRRRPTTAPPVSVATPPAG
jgi:uncharacterized protein YjeT (DUF2065 family)